jgi:phosphoribosylanthranilate isomerase
MSVMVKICGINSLEAADATVRAGADLAGFAFHPASPRRVGPETARALAEHLRGRIRLCAFLSDAGDETIASAVAATRPDFIQLHGNETPGRVAEVRARFGAAVIKAISIAEASDFAGLSAFEDVADMILFDAKAPVDATRAGGHGVAFDWQLLRRRSYARPWLLAGGLNAENVARAIAVSGAPGVDVSSGVETSPGRKSADMIRAFVSTAKNAQFVSEARS